MLIEFSISINSLTHFAHSPTYVVSDEIRVEVIDDVRVFVLSHHQNLIDNQFLNRQMGNDN